MSWVNLDKCNTPMTVKWWIEYGMLEGVEAELICREIKKIIIIIKCVGKAVHDQIRSKIGI